ncbi:MAG: 3-dehydroquinate synthase, partial [Leptolyngbya sp. SIO1D8]|nr:3-dehydroquinate synthase [Leptolyngbya sp. SIO1D8]
MTTTTLAVKAFINTCDSEPLTYQDLDSAVEALCCSTHFKNLLLSLIDNKAFSQELGREFAAIEALPGLSACRSLRSCLNFSLSHFFGLMAELIVALDTAVGAKWHAFANRMYRSNLGANKLLDRLLRSQEGAFYQELADRLVVENPHAIYPTSSYRESQGFV